MDSIDVGSVPLASMLLTRLVLSDATLRFDDVALVREEYRDWRDRAAADSLEHPRLRRRKLPSRVDREVADRTDDPLIVLAIDRATDIPSGSGSIVLLPLLLLC